MEKDHKTFNRIGYRLRGPQWRSALAHDLNVNERTVRRWSNGEYEIPVDVWIELAGLCLRFGNQLIRYHADLIGD